MDSSRSQSRQASNQPSSVQREPTDVIPEHGQNFLAHLPSRIPAQQTRISEAQQDLLPESKPQLSRRNRLRGTAVSTFRGFMDNFDSPAPAEPTQEELHDTRTPAQTQEQPAESMGMKPELSANTDTESAQPGEKRPRSQSIDVDAELFPAHAAMKRQRLDNPSITQEGGSRAETTKREAIVRKKKELDVQEAIRKQREKEAEAQRMKDEPMQDVVAQMTFEEMQNLAIVEEYDIKPQNKEQRERQLGDRWDERWNGRKNFKKFRRKGEAATSSRAPRVIVALEEVKNPGVGVRDSFFSGEAQQRGFQKPARARSTTSQDDTDGNTHQEEVPAELLGGDQPEVIDVDAPRTTRAADRASYTSERTPNLSLKRQISSSTTSTGKRQRRLNLPKDDEEEGSSEEEDVPKFRFRKR
jgi:hypothetical protein